MKRKHKTKHKITKTQRRKVKAIRAFLDTLLKK
jgi:hypothetical protein